MWAGSSSQDSYSLILCFCSSRSLPFSVLLNFIINNGSTCLRLLGCDMSTDLGIRSFSVDWWLWLAATGFSIGLVTRYGHLPFWRLAPELTCSISVKMIGLFVTALVGVYTIEDLWEKFGDTRMSLVSSRFFPSIYPVNSSCSTHTARSNKTLGRSYRLSYHSANPCLHGFVQNPFHGPQSFRTWRCTNGFFIPSEPNRK